MLMALIHEKSCECVKSELDLFALPLTQASVENGRWVDKGPISSLDGDAPIEFKIEGSETEYIDLSNSYIYVKAKIIKEDGTNLVGETDAAPINLFLHGLFSQVDMTLGDTLVTSNSSPYPYRAYLETLLSFGNTAKESQFTSSLWFKDTAGHMGITDNTGWTSRKAFIALSKSVDMLGKLHLDMMFQDRYILNNVDIRLRLIRARNEFCLMADEAVKVQLEKVVLKVRKVRLNPAVALAHAEALETETAKYPIKRVDCKSYTISTGLMSHTEENLFSGQLPKRIVIGMVKNSSYNGILAENPFNFQHFNLNYLSLIVDGQQVMGKPLQPIFPAAANQPEAYIESYMSLFSGTGMIFKDEGNCISRNEYKAGYTLFAFDLTADMEESGHVQLVKHGNVSLELKFAQALAATINVVIYAEFENLIEINKERSVLFDYGG